MTLPGGGTGASSGERQLSSTLSRRLALAALSLLLTSSRAAARSPPPTGKGADLFWVGHPIVIIGY